MMAKSLQMTCMKQPKQSDPINSVTGVWPSTGIERLREFQMK